MTPCENLGYKVGDKFEVTEGSTFPNSSYHQGEIVSLSIDDGSLFPFFISEEKNKSYCISLCKVKKITRDTDTDTYRLSDTGRAGSAPAESKTTNNADAFAIVNLISSVCPGLKVEDALEIASTLIDDGFKR